MANLLQVQNGTKSFGARVLFQDATFAVNEGEHIGVIGPNGAGKTTLFRILTGEESLDTGLIVKSTGLRLGYLAQEDHWAPGQTIEDFLAGRCLTPIWELKSFGRRLGLDEAMFARPVTALSGGYRMRVKLLYLIGMQPNLMLLDEPTNYLDLETLLVLEEFLLGYGGAFLLISHDREFLRRTTDHIVEVEAGDISKFNGNIDDYFEQKELLRSQLEKRAESLQAKRAAVLDFAARFGAKATKARQVQSRLKSLEKMETIEVKPVPVASRIRLPEPPRTGKSVMRVAGADFGYGERTVLKGVDFELLKGDHLGIVGLNGAGKTTLLKGLAKELQPLRGEVALGLGAEIAYFAQHVAEKLKPGDTVLEAMGEFAHPDTTRQEILDLAGALLFSGDDIQKKIRVLSGGEKSRVALGQMLLKKASCLLLDEPTNHLDFQTVEALTQALADYPGSVVIVSHDRGFVRRTATKILEIRGGRVDLYPGTYDEYVWSLQKGGFAERVGAGEGSSSASGTRGANAPGGSPGGGAARDVGTAPGPGGAGAAGLRSGHFEAGRGAVNATGAAPGVGGRGFNYKEQKKAWEKELRAVEKEAAEAEAKIEREKARVEELGARLLTVSGAEAAACAKELSQAQAEIDRLEERWLELGARGEELGGKIKSLVSS